MNISNYVEKHVVNVEKKERFSISSEFEIYLNYIY